MQNDHTRQPESPLPDPSSPPFPALRRHHQPQPTPTAEAYRDTSPSGSTLRRRHVPAEGDVIRIDVRTPFDDGVSRIKEGVPIHRSTTIREIKDDVTAGKFGQGGIWQRDGMRIVWQGRIVRDEEVVGEVVANSRGNDVVHTLHLVARRLGGTPAIGRVASGYFNQPIPVPPVPVIPTAQRPATITPAPTQQPINARPESQALLDSIHYLLFTARHHLFYVLGREPLRWGDMVPAPIVDQSFAREAVMSVIRTIVDARPVEERASWEGWEAAFNGDDTDDVGRIWSSAGSRDNIEADIRATWRHRVGRDWSTGEKGEIVEVEIDQNIYQLHLPRLNMLTASQLVHLQIYLKITSLLPMLYPFLPTPPSSTHTRPQSSTPAPVPPRPTFRSAIAQAATYIPRIPLSVLQHMFFSALKSVAMLWMLTQGMPWSDSRLWIMAGAVSGWWVADGWQQYVRERPRTPRVQVQGPGEPGQQEGEAGVAAQNVPAAPALAAAGSTTRNRRALHLAIPLIHLDTDTTQLRLINDSTNPTRQLEVARTPSQPVRRPPRIVTQLLLPVALWFITLIPEFEAIRTRTIRKRERAMRVLVGELNAPIPTENTDHPSESNVAEQETPAGIGQELTLPEGLNEEAKKYYLRVMERGEGIDWEEEREAQRAMGVGEEEGQGGLIGLF